MEYSSVTSVRLTSGLWFNSWKCVYDVCMQRCSCDSCDEHSHSVRHEMSDILHQPIFRYPSPFDIRRFEKLFLICQVSWRWCRLVFKLHVLAGGVGVSGSTQWRVHSCCERHISQNLTSNQVLNHRVSVAVIRDPVVSVAVQLQTAERIYARFWSPIRNEM